jgi:hypothetical protein
LPDKPTGSFYTRRAPSELMLINVQAPLPVLLSEGLLDARLMLLRVHLEQDQLLDGY